MMDKTGSDTAWSDVVEVAYRVDTLIVRDIYRLISIFSDRMPQALNEMANSEEAIVREAVGEVSHHCYYTIFSMVVSRR